MSTSVTKVHDSGNWDASNNRAEVLREDFKVLRERIEQSDLPERRKKDLLGKLEHYEQMLIEKEDRWSQGDNYNDITEKGSNQNVTGGDQFNVIPREFNIALEGFRSISKEVRAAGPAKSRSVEPTETEKKPTTVVGGFVATTDADAAQETLDSIGEAGGMEDSDLEPPPGADGPEPGSNDSPLDGGDGIGSLEFDGMSVDQMLNGLNDDPQEVMNHIQGLDVEDKQMAMQMLQQRLQQINQMFSMLTNLAKTRHDTAKAAINNMRV